MDTKFERCGQCLGKAEDCDLCEGSGRVERCVACHAAIDPKDGAGVCFYCDVMGESPDKPKAMKADGSG